MKIGFSKAEITPPIGTELGGYAGYRPCSGVHDPLYCKAVVLEQDGIRYALLALDLLCVDTSLHQRIADAVADLGISKERLIAAAIHSHAAPLGMIPGEGELASVNDSIVPKDALYEAFTHRIFEAARETCAAAIGSLEPFEVRTAKGDVPPVGSERHTGEKARGSLTVIEIRTESGKNLIIHNFPCHPTVLSAANLQVSADFAGCIEPLLGADMAMFLNSAAGDISTRFTRRESTFAECARMGQIAADCILAALEGKPYRQPGKLQGIQRTITLQPRPLESEEVCQKLLEETTSRWKQAEKEGADPGTLRILKSYVEGAGVNLEFARTMGNIQAFHVPVTVFRFAGLTFTTIPGELFSPLLPSDLCAICYANGYHRYIADENAYDAGYYEAMASILKRGQGEYLTNEIETMIRKLNELVKETDYEHCNPIH